VLPTDKPDRVKKYDTENLPSYKHSFNFAKIAKITLKTTITILFLT